MGYLSAGGMEDTVFKIVLGVLVAIMMGVRLGVMRRRGGIQVVRADYSPVEVWLDRWNRVWAIPTVIYLLTNWLDWFGLPFLDWARWTGAVLLGCGVGLFYWAHQALGDNWMPFIEIRAEHVLVLTVPYRWVRHPMYLSFFGVGFGELFLSANWLVGLIVIPQVLLYWVRVPRDEQLLEEAFGAAYRQYQWQTGRLLPQLWGRK